MLPALDEEGWMYGAFKPGTPTMDDIFTIEPAEVCVFVQYRIHTSLLDEFVLLNHLFYPNHLTISPPRVWW